MSHIPFQLTNWDNIPTTEHPGETGMAYWKTIQYDTFRVRQVVYSPGYKADHWCEKGHIIYCIEGEMVSELKSGETHILSKGMSYHVSDDASSHRSTTTTGATLFIIDGDFLKSST